MRTKYEFEHLIFRGFMAAKYTRRHMDDDFTCTLQSWSGVCGMTTSLMIKYQEQQQKIWINSSKIEKKTIFIEYRFWVPYLNFYLQIINSLTKSMSKICRRHIYKINESKNTIHISIWDHTCDWFSYVEFSIGFFGDNMVKNWISSPICFCCDVLF